MRAEFAVRNSKLAEGRLTLADLVSLANTLTAVKWTTRAIIILVVKELQGDVHFWLFDVETPIL
jgi:hypothetical protein